LTLPAATCKLAAALKPQFQAIIVTAKKSRSPELDLEGAAPAATPPPADFESSLTELESIVEQLEQGDLSLDDSLKQFERGVQLTRVCQGALKQAEQKVEILLRKTGQSGSRNEGGDEESDDFETAPFRSGDE